MGSLRPSKTSARPYAARRALEWTTSEACQRKQMFAAFSSKLTLRAAPRVLLRERGSNDLERACCYSNVCNVVCASALRKTKKASLISAVIPTKASQTEAPSFLEGRRLPFCHSVVICTRIVQEIHDFVHGPRSARLCARVSTACADPSVWLKSQI